MKHLFDPNAAEAIQARIRSLTPQSPRLWGRMEAAQALAHCGVGLEAALGDRTPRRVFLGRILGRLVKGMALGNDRPFQRNSPTSPEFIISDPRELALEQARLCALVARFAAGGPAGCTLHPHAFFGTLTPEEWSVLMYKHLDHHLRQFGA